MIRKLLTARQVEAAKSGPARREIPDGGTGLYLVVQPSGKKSWAYRYRYDGSPKKLTIGSYPAWKLADARERAGELAKAVDKGHDPAYEKRERKQRGVDRVQGVGEAFIKNYAKPRNRSWRLVERAFEIHLYPVIGDRDITQVTRRDILDVLDRAASTGATTANRVLANTRKLFNWAVERDIIEASPVAGIRAPAAERHRDRVLTSDELCAIVRACRRLEEPFGSMFQMLLLTAQRRNEVSGAPWSEFDLENALWTIPGDRTKNGRTNEVPLSPQALAVLEALRTKGSKDHLFPSRRTKGKTASGFGRAKANLDKLMLEELRKLAEERGGDPDRAALPAWRLHDIRRTCASGMARLGIGIHVVERLLNHVSGSTTGGIISVYQRHDFRPEKLAAVTAWANYLDDLDSQETDEKVVKLRPNT